MPLINGLYIQTEDSPYEKATTYQLKNYITSALVAIYKIENESTSDINLFHNKIQYYRFYLDKAFYCLGQIHSRFSIVSKGNPNILTTKNEIVALNRSNYIFSEDAFPLLSNKTPRNIIEHLDERNLLTIKENKFVGGFNVIFEDSDSEMILTLLNKRNHYPYTLDLRSNTVYFYNIQEKHDGNKEFQISLNELKDELLRLEKNVNALDNYLTT